MSLFDTYYGTNTHRNVTDIGALTQEALAETEQQLAQREEAVVLLLPSTVADASKTRVIEPLTTKIADLQASLGKKGRPLDHVLVGIDQAKTKEEYERARQPFEKIPNVVTMWNDHETMREVYTELGEVQGLGTIPAGKGRNVWTLLALRHFLAPNAHILIHDSDILPKIYDKRFILGLARPLLDGAAFSKGYYLRLAEKEGRKRLSARVKRLLVNPLLEALSQEYAGNARITDFVRFHQALKYQLSGEVSMAGRVVDEFAFQWDWGLEAGTNAGIYAKSEKVVIIDFGLYDHKHSSESFNDPNKGLYRMAREVAKTMLRAIYATGQGDINSPTKARAILTNYQDAAHRAITQYESLSRERWSYDPQDEARRVRLFKKALGEAFDTIVQYPDELSPLQPWCLLEENAPSTTKQLRAFYETLGITAAQTP